MHLFQPSYWETLQKWNIQCKPIGLPTKCLIELVNKLRSKNSCVSSTVKFSPFNLDLHLFKLKFLRKESDVQKFKYDHGRKI